MDSIEKLNTAITLVEEARGVPLSASCVVHRSEMLEILDGARESLPQDLFRAEDILARAKEQDPSVSQATVYRTLAMLEKAGTVLKNEFDGAGARYELAGGAHHDHLIDLDTGAVIEFHSAKIERLQAEIAAELGYAIEWHRLELYGRRQKT